MKQSSETFIALIVLSLVTFITTSLYLVERVRRKDAEYRLEQVALNSGNAPQPPFSKEDNSVNDIAETEKNPLDLPQPILEESLRDEESNLENSEEVRARANLDSEGGPDELLAERQWVTTQTVREVSKLVTVPESAKEELEQKLSTIPVSELSNERLTGVVAEVVSPEVGESLRTALEAQDKVEAEAEIDVKLAVLTQRLGLSSDQEGKVKEVLSVVRTELKDQQKSLSKKMEEAMGQHFGDKKDREELRTSFEDIQKMQDEIKSNEEALLREKLIAALTKEQFEQWSNEQAAHAAQ